jgi:hypothetical protein
MTTFAIIAPEGSEKLKSAVLAAFGDDSFEMAPGQFVVVARDMTSQQIAEKLGATGQVGRFIVFTSAGQYGWHRKDLWEWLAVKSAA